MKSSLFAALALSAVAVASAQPPNPPTPQQQAAWEAKRMERLALLLDLNEGQTAQVQSILDAQRAKAQEALAQLRASGTPPTRDQIKALHDQIKADTQQQLASVLTPIQLKKFEVLTEKFGPRRHFRGGPPGPVPDDAPPAGPGSQN